MTQEGFGRVIAGIELAAVGQEDNRAVSDRLEGCYGRKGENFIEGHRSTPQAGDVTRTSFSQARFCTESSAPVKAAAPGSERLTTHCGASATGVRLPRPSRIFP